MARWVALLWIATAIAAVGGCDRDAQTESQGDDAGAKPRPAAPAETASGPTEREDGEPAAGGAASGAPRAAIRVDGRADDWDRIPILLDVAAAKNRPTHYDCRAIKIARDETNLYVLFILGRGVGERFDEQMQRTGKPTSGALGYLRLTSEGRKFVLWIPTGVSISYDSRTDEVIHEPWVGFDAAGAAITEDVYDPVLEADSSGQPGNIAFEGKHLELAIPLDKMGITGEAPFEATLEEMWTASDSTDSP